MNSTVSRWKYAAFDTPTNSRLTGCDENYLKFIAGNKEVQIDKKNMKESVETETKFVLNNFVKALSKKALRPGHRTFFYLKNFDDSKFYDQALK